MCIFCKIVNGEIPSFKIYESEHTLAFLDISQNTVGHTLVIPKQHVNNVFELDSETGKEVFDAVLKTVQILKYKLQIENVNLLNNNGSLAGQVVEHYHIHIIPRYGNDECYFKESPHEPNFEELAKLHKQITL
jgi:histidine triad (HIT) family protein